MNGNMITEEGERMDKLEKVIKGLECCRIDENRHINCADCPYYTDDDKGQMWCSNEINNDAIELLKEQKERIAVLEEEAKTKGTPQKVLNRKELADLIVGECPLCGALFNNEICPVSCGWCGCLLDWKECE